MQAISALAGQNYAAARPATEPQGTGTAGEAAVNLARDFTATLQQAEQTAQAAMTGGADPHALVQALAQTELAVEAAVTVRDKVVEAYQEILRMPV
ncbi:flagellar hook-basal body complex protein FliE [Lutimaribacter sp. EGI FJ00015]|uniref:Flagellar hook-basal body complex protein FliE n=1 Tax=Lutimaribacter degradans TaxID=2945989 RepID=A0ACC5ZUA4_9RHOB|nr:flagellar hook-basal body complex protein FliE [Lutimaribacter sp. EGI FJ00013]MCM2561896.1 flagellar hook-basal body complex protein FliE [Lutimaribacter sp. EGI FJ00013]MCO0613072.1 flagellar hook-basal body complex protein FliE [Lutimaribacter sp. EGI FJ00015]MCO0635728.1 flagellar hook-basal body complex protein FliE [Lutimaribacter sp. EGI FJ00014]